MLMNKILFLLVFLVLAACLNENSEYESINLAKKAFVDGNLNEANIHAKNALLKNNKNGQARFIMAEIAHIEGRMTDAEIDYQRALEADFSPSLVLPNYIDTLLLLGNHNDIPALIKDLPTELQAQKKYWQGLFYLGDNYLDLANQAFEDSIDISNDNYAKPFLGKALIASETKNYEQAIRYLDNALAIEKNYLDAKLLKSELLVKTDSDARALPLLLEILALPKHLIPSKKYFIAKTTLIQIYWQQEDIRLAEKHTVELLKRYPKNPIAAYYGAVVNFERGNYSQANNFLQQVLRASPEHAASLGLMGSVKYRQGFYEQADFYLSSALAYDNSDAELIKLLAAARLRQNQTTSAIELLDGRNTQKSDPLILWLSGKAKIQAGDIDAGMVLLDQAAAISDKGDIIKNDIAQTYLSMGQLEKALSTLNEIDDYEFANQQKELFYIFDLIQKNQLDLALTATQDLIAKKQNNPFLFIALGKIYLANSQKDEALAAFAQAKRDDAQIPANLLIANLHIQNKNFQKALAAYNEILNIQNDNFEALTGKIGLATITNDENSYKLAVKALQEKHPNNPETYLIQAAKALNEKNFSDAENFLLRVLQLNDEHITAVLMLATSYISNNKRNSALALLEEKTRKPALEKNPHLHYQLASLYQQNNNLIKAANSLQVATQLRPDNLQYLKNYIQVLLQTEKTDVAQDALDNFLIRNPKNAQAFALAGDFYLANQNLTAAASLYENAFKLQTNETNLINLYRIANRQNKTDSEQYLIRWLQQYPNAYEVRNELASHFVRSGNYQSAIQHYEFLYTANIINPAVLNNLAWAYLQTGNRRALSIGQQAHQLAPSSPEIIDTYGWILTNMGQLQRGIELLEQSSAMRPESIDMRYHLAYAYVQNGQNPKAQNLLNSMLEIAAAAPYQQKIKQLLAEIN